MEGSESLGEAGVMPPPMFLASVRKLKKIEGLDGFLMQWFVQSVRKPKKTDELQFSLCF